jgi:hypothetical protein
MGYISRGQAFRVRPLELRDANTAEGEADLDGQGLMPYTAPDLPGAHNSALGQTG